MGMALELLIEEVKGRRIFKRNKKDVRLKVLAAILYYLGISLRKTSSFMTVFQTMSHEAVRIYYHRLKSVIQSPQKKKRIITYLETIRGLENSVEFTKWKVSQFYHFVGRVLQSLAQPWP